MGQADKTAFAATHGVPPHEAWRFQRTAEHLMPSLKTVAEATTSLLPACTAIADGMSASSPKS